MIETQIALPEPKPIGSASMSDVIISNTGAFQRVMAAGEMFAKSNFLGKSVSVNGAAAAVLVMMHEGLDPVQFKQRYNIINDTPSRTPNSLLGDFVRMGGDYDIIQADSDACEISFTRKGKKPYKVRISMEEMCKTSIPWSKSGELKDNWRNFPDDMLFARVCGKGLRRVAPELMGGIYTTEEVEDFAVPIASTCVEAITVEQVKDRIAKTEPTPVPTEPAADATVVEVKPAPEEAKPEPDTDFTKCPLEGVFKDVPFAEMDEDVLQALLVPRVQETHPELTDKHVETARKELNRKKENTPQEN